MAKYLRHSHRVTLSIACSFVLLAGLPARAADDETLGKDTLIRGWKKGPAAPRDPKAKATGGRLITPIHFGNGSAVIESRSILQLDEIAAAMSDTQLASSRFAIEGHTDHIGSSASNQALSEQRAFAVRTALVARGIAADRLTARGYGESRPLSDVDPNDPSQRVRNRRVEIVNVGDSSPTTSRPLNVEMRVRYGPEASPTWLSPGGKLTASEPFAIYFKPNQDCYVYIFQEDASGVRAVFPDPGAASDPNPVRSDREYWLPSDGQRFWLTGSPGKERILLVASPTRLDDPRESLEQQRGPAATTRPNLRDVFHFAIPFIHN